MALIGKKICMSNCFRQGEALAVTAVKIEPCYVVSINNYLNSVSKETKCVVSIAAFEKNKGVNKAQLGLYNKLNLPSHSTIASFPSVDFFLKSEDVSLGSKYGIEVLKVGDFVDVVGKSKGKGFQGAVKRHGVSRGPMSHGSRYHRSPGSMGGRTDPGRVFKNKKLPGRMGFSQVTVQNLEIVSIDIENSLVFLKGGVPGFYKGIVFLKKTVKVKNKVLA